MLIQDNLDNLADEREKINFFQFSLIGSCFITAQSFSNLPLDLFLGKGYSFLIYVLYFTLLSPLFIFIQFRLSNKFPEGLLGIHEKYSPWTLIFTISTIVYNFYILILNSVSVSYSLSYIFFNLFPCDMKYCVAKMFIWDSCNDAWSLGACSENERKIFSGPTPEENFFVNFVLGRDLNPNVLSGFANWFDIPCLTLLPYFLGWFITVLLIIGGPKYFTSLLFVLGPLSIGSLFSCCVYIGIEASKEDENLLDFLLNFFKKFPTRQYFSFNIWDDFSFQPLYWGLISTLVNLSSLSRIFNGVYPVIAMWLPRGKKNRNLFWIMTILTTGIINYLPILFVLLTSVAGYDEKTLRCHLASGWAIPFTMIPHIFSKYSTRKIITTSFFVGLSTSYLLSQGLLLMCTLENILLHMVKWSPQAFSGNHHHRPTKVHTIYLYLLATFLSLIGVIFMTTSGYHWYRIVDWYKDRLFAVVVFVQCISLLILYLKTRPARFESVLVKSVYSVFYGLAILVFIISWMWYGFHVNEKHPDDGCRTLIKPEKDPLLNLHYRTIGWVIAALPLILGMVFGYFASSRNSQIAETPICPYLLHGEVAIERAHNDNLFPDDSQEMFQKNPFLNNFDQGYNTNPFSSSRTLNSRQNKTREENRYIQPQMVHYDPYEMTTNRAYFDSRDDDPYLTTTNDESNYAMTLQPNQQSYYHHQSGINLNSPEIFNTGARYAPRRPGIYKTKSSHFI